MFRQETHNGFIRTCEYTKLDPAAMDRAQSIFREYQGKGVILNEHFEDEIWTLSDQKHTVSFRFHLDHEAYEKNAKEWACCPPEGYLKAVRSFILLHLGMLVLNTLRTFVSVLLDLVNVPFADLELTAHEQMIFRFLDMLPGESPARDAFMERLDTGFPTVRSNSRKLAGFRHYVAFEEALKQNWESAGQDERVHLFPVYFWWRLTSILPLRPTEYLLTPLHCLEKQDGKIWLTVRRTRMKKGLRQVSYRISEDYAQFAYCIPEELGALVEGYLHATEGKTRVLDTLLVPERNSRYLNYSVMNDLLHETEFRLLGTKQIRLGDTRHLSLISLILSGDTPSVCMALANQDSPVVSAGYYTNMSTLGECSVFNYLRDTLASVPLSLSEQRSGLPEGDLVRVGNGYCDFHPVLEGDVSECGKVWTLQSGMGDCMKCRHFWPDSGSLCLDLKAQSRQDLEAGFLLLMDAIEDLRKSQGKMENLENRLMEVRNSASRYFELMNKGDH